MRFRSTVIILLVLIFGVAVLMYFKMKAGYAPRPTTAGTEPVESQMPPLMTPVPSASDTSIIVRKSLLGALHFNAFEAATGDVSLCAGDNICLEDAETIKGWLCVANVCDGKDRNKNPTDCFKEVSASVEVRDQINKWICPLIKSPGMETRRAFMIHVPVINSNGGGGEDSLVKMGAHLLALTQSAAKCEDYIKNYVGAYGPQWNYQWYGALSGCRILARARTREEEEKDFDTWIGVTLGEGNCFDIVNGEMRHACNTPGITSPMPVLINDQH